MAWELPLERSVERQARPKAVFGKMNPGRGLGAASALAGGVGFPKLTGMKKLASGGIVGYGGGGSYAKTDPGSQLDYLDYGLPMQGEAANSPGIPSAASMPPPSLDTSAIDIPQNQNNDAIRDASGLAGKLANQGIAYRQGKNGYSYDQTGKAVDPDTGQPLSGFQGWEANKHTLGLTGSDWLKTALIAATGILGQAAAKKNNSQALKAVAPPSGHNMIAPAIGVNPQGYGITGGYAAGGPAMPQQMPPQSPQNAPQGPSQPGMASQDPQSQTIVINAAKALMGQLDPQAAQAAIQAFVQAFGQDALMQLAQQIKGAGGNGTPQQPQGGIAQGMASGGALMSDGGGMDDTIPANNGQVRLSGGEFIVPSDAVSSLGDGNNAAGAKKLEHGIAQLRTMKYGRAKQPPKLPHGSNPVFGQ